MRVLCGHQHGMSLHSLLPHGENDGEAVNNLAGNLGGHVFSHEALVNQAVPVHLAGLHELELGVVDEFLRDDLASDHEDTLDLKAGLSSEHANFTERVLAEALESLDETLKEVLELVFDLTLSSDLVVMEVPEGVALSVNLRQVLVETLTLLVLNIDEVGLEHEKIEGGGGQGLERVDHLLLLNFLTIFTLGLGGSSGLLGLLLRLDDGLDALLGHLDLSEDSDELGEGSNARKPCACLGGGLGEALVEDKLEGHRHGGGEDDIGNRYAGANDPVASKGLIDGSKGLLEDLHGIHEFGLGDLVGSTGAGHDSGVDGGERSTDDPVHPLVDLSALNGVGAE